MKVIGITGNIGCGKSTVCKIFTDKYNIPVFSADLVAKGIIKSNREVITAIIEMFGKGVINEDFTINRRYIFDHVFINKETLDRYNKILHPPVIKAFAEWKAFFFQQNKYPYIIEESALIFEAGTAASFNEIISVNCDLDTRIKRASTRSGLTEDEVRLIDSHQIPWLQKWQKSSLSILNHGDLANLEAHVDYLHQYLTYNPDANKSYGEMMEETWMADDLPVIPTRFNDLADDDILGR